jgi:hypothetical protein
MRAGEREKNQDSKELEKPPNGENDNKIPKSEIKLHNLQLTINNIPNVFVICDFEFGICFEFRI